MNAPLTEKSTLVQVMAWCWRGAKPFPEPMLTQILSPYHDMASPGHNELRENNSPIIYATEFNFVTHCASTLKIFSLQFIVCFFRSSQQNKDIVLHHFKITITVFVSKSAYLIEQQIKIQINQVYLTGSRCLLATWSHEHAGWLTGHLLSRLQPIYSLRVDAWPTEHVTVYTKKSGEPFLQCFESFKPKSRMFQCNTNGLVKDCGNSSMLAIQLLQSWTKPSIWILYGIGSKLAQAKASAKFCHDPTIIIRERNLIARFKFWAPNHWRKGTPLINQSLSETGTLTMITNIDRSDI